MITPPPWFATRSYLILLRRGQLKSHLPSVQLPTRVGLLSILQSRATISPSVLLPIAARFLVLPFGWLSPEAKRRGLVPWPTKRREAEEEWGMGPAVAAAAGEEEGKGWREEGGSVRVKSPIMAGGGLLADTANPPPTPASPTVFQSILGFQIRWFLIDPPNVANGFLGWLAKQKSKFCFLSFFLFRFLSLLRLTLLMRSPEEIVSKY